MAKSVQVSTTSWYAEARFCRLFALVSLLEEWPLHCTPRLSVHEGVDLSDLQCHARNPCANTTVPPVTARRLGGNPSNSSPWEPRRPWLRGPFRSGCLEFSRVGMSPTSHSRS